MKIKKAKIKDLNIVFNILQAGNRWLIKQNMLHWKGFYTKEKVITNIKEKQTFILSENNISLGTFTISYNKPKIYDDKITKFIKNPKGKTLYPSALSILPSKQKKGYARKAIEFIEKKARKENCKNIIFDAHSSYKKLNDFYKKLNYKIIGKIKGTKSTGNIYHKSI